MGAISFSIDPDLVEALCERRPFDLFFESGGYKGDSVALVQAHFPRIVTVELSELYVGELRARFKDSKKVEVVHGDSAQVLKQRHQELSAQGVLYWLDAHWCAAPGVLMKGPQCPLLDELAALGKLNEHSVVIIDDARLFLAPPPQPHAINDWPSFFELKSRLDRCLGATHEYLIVNDCIVVFPSLMRDAVIEYARARGADWLKIADLARDHSGQAQAARERLMLAQQLESDLVAARSTIEQLQADKQRLLDQLSQTSALFASQRAELHSLEAQWLKSLEDLATARSSAREKETVIQVLREEHAASAERIRVLEERLDHQRALLGESARLHRELDSELEVTRVRAARVLSEFERTLSLMADSGNLLGEAAQQVALHRERLAEEQRLARVVARKLRRDTSAYLKEHAAMLRSLTNANAEVASLLGSDTRRNLLADESEISSRPRNVPDATALATTLRDNLLRVKRQYEELAENARLTAAAFASLISPAAEAQIKGDSLQLLRAALERVQHEASAKEHVIQELSAAVHAYRAAIERPKFLQRLLHRARSAVQQLFQPRLGVLYQHAPIDFTPPPLPTRYSINESDLPTISIVTPSFRQAHLIERTISSIVDQQYAKLDYHIQDGGSDDGTVAILQRWSNKLATWQSHPDAGQSQAINLGFARTNGEIMAWVNSDDILLPGSLRFVAEYFMRNPDVDVMYSNRLLIDEHDKLIGRWVLPGHDGEVLRWADFVPQETLFWRRRIWDAVGGVDETFRFAMDWDLLLRFKRAGARFSHCNVFLGAFRIHERQKTSAEISQTGLQEMDRLRQREHGRKVSHTEIRRALALFMVRHIIADRLLSLRLRKYISTHPN